MILVRKKMRKTGELKGTFQSERWKEEIKGFVRRTFPVNDRAHGFEHADAVERMALEISREPEFATLNNLDRTVLSAAALLHDIGYAESKEIWSPDKVEHIATGTRIAREFLSILPPFSHDPILIEKVCYLIFHHDDTNYSFPIVTREGRPAKTLLCEQEPEWQFISREHTLDVETLLRILREADGRAGTGLEGVQRTLYYSIGRGLNPFADPDRTGGNPLNAWMWEESAVGNIRLAMKRALLDAVTRNGKEIAWKGYEKGEEVIKDYCRENGIHYEAEVAFQTGELRPAGKRDQQLPVEIVRLHSWKVLADRLREVPLLGDVSLHPYEGATIKSQFVDIERLSPLSRYVLSSQRDLHIKLRNALLDKYALDTLDMADIMEFKSNGQIAPPIAPPIIEVYEEKSGDVQGEIWAVVDGTHRLWLAREYGIDKIRAVVIRGIPEQLPLIAFPLRWTDVKVVEEVPDESRKRDYRFPTLEYFPDISQFSKVQVNEQNYLRFFYRDLRMLGSSGTRASNGSTGQ